MKIEDYVQIKGGVGDTVGVVDYAISKIEKAKNAKIRYIHTYCVFDRDDHRQDRFNDAFQKAKNRSDITIIWAQTS